MKGKNALAAVIRYWERCKGRDILIFVRTVSIKALVNIFIVDKLGNGGRYERGNIAAVNDYVANERR